MELYARPKQDALKTLNSTEGGLTQEEAERRLAAFGKNGASPPSSLPSSKTS